MFVLTHRPPDLPDPDVTYLTGDIGEGVATALHAAGGKNLQILGADVAGQCLRRGLVDEILVYVLPVLLGDGIRFSSPGLARIDLEPLSSTQADGVTILEVQRPQVVPAGRPGHPSRPSCSACAVQRSAGGCARRSCRGRWWLVSAVVRYGEAEFGVEGAVIAAGQHVG